jgi:DNA-binding ferritin-like protein
MIDPTTPDEDEAFNEIERMSKIKMEIIRAQKIAIHVEGMNRVKKAFDEEMQLQAKTQQEVYDDLRNDILEQVAQHIEKLTGFGQDTISSFAIYIREMKK